MSPRLEALLTDEAGLEAFTATLHDSRARAIGRKRMWLRQPQDVRASWILAVASAIRTALDSQLSPLAREPLADPPAIGDVLVMALAQTFPCGRGKPYAQQTTTAGRLRAVARLGAEQAAIWRPALIAGLSAYAALGSVPAALSDERSAA